jgi:hypothetical protein
LRAEGNTFGLRKDKKGFREIKDLPEPHIGAFRKLFLITSSRRLGVLLKGLFDYEGITTN